MTGGIYSGPFPPWSRSGSHTKVLALSLKFVAGEACTSTELAMYVVLLRSSLRTDVAELCKGSESRECVQSSA